MTLAATSTASPPAPRWMVIALFASLALNLVIAGATVGFVWRHSGAVSDAQVAHLPPNLLSYASTLPAARQKELSARTEEQRQNVRPLRRQLREAREEAVTALVAEPFDRAALSGGAVGVACGRPEGARGGPPALCGDRRQHDLRGASRVRGLAPEPAQDAQSARRAREAGQGSARADQLPSRTTYRPIAGFSLAAGRRRMPTRNRHHRPTGSVWRPASPAAVGRA